MTHAPRESLLPVNGLEIALCEWPGEGPPLLFCHAAGFHARIWDQVIAHLPGRQCFAFDARGHGRSSQPAPPYIWRNFGADVAALADSLELSGAIGVGHSLGGHAITLGAALRPNAFARLLLMDPVIRPKDQYAGPNTEAGFVAKRRNHWNSAEQMFQHFENRPPFSLWSRAVLRDYCQYGLTPAGEAFVLACPPHVEASIYERSTAVESNIYPELETIQIPVHVVRSGRHRDAVKLMKSSPTAPGLALSFTHGTDTCLEEHSHFIPMEAPELAAKLIVEALGEIPALL